MDIIGESTLTTLQAPASITADGSTAGIDARSLAGQGGLLLTGFATAGTLPTLAVKLQAAPDGDVVTSVTPGVGNAGSGTCTQVYGGPDAVAETITLTFSDANTVVVSGSVTGPLAIEATVGTLYQSSIVEFMLTAGTDAFEAADTFVIITTARTYSDVGVAFTSLTTNRSIQKVGVNFDKLNRFLRVTYDIGGSDNPAYAVAVAAISEVR